MTLIDPRILRTRVKTILEDATIPVLTRRDNPPTSGRWAILDGPGMFDDEDDINVCGDYLTTVADITVMCAGTNADPETAAALAGWAAKKATELLTSGPLLPGTTTPRRLATRPLGPDDDTATVWSYPLALRIHG